jgi:hypothetical protein
MTSQIRQEVFKVPGEVARMPSKADIAVGIGNRSKPAAIIFIAVRRDFIPDRVGNLN